MQMPSGYKGCLTLILACAAALSGCGPARPGADEWGVLIGALPKSVHLKNASDTPTFYIVRQTHEPLFRQDDGQNYSSRLLKRWSRSPRSMEYVLCPSEGISFDKTEPFTPERFFLYLSSVTAVYDPTGRVELRDGCAGVRFASPRPGYLDFLARYENAPSIETGKNAEAGLGRFYVESLNADRIVLKRKEYAANGYNRIVLHEYKGPGDPLLESRNISDFNKLSDFQQPGWIRREYAGFNNIEMRVSALAINIADVKVRDAVYNCMETEKFRRAYLPDKSNFLDVRQVLPLGISGGAAGKPSQACTPARRRVLNGKTIVLANPYKTNQKQLSDFSDWLLRETGLRLIVKNYDPRNLVSELKDPRRSKTFDLLVMVADTVRPEYAPFFEYYLGPESALDRASRELKEGYQSLLAADGLGQKREIAVDLADRLEKGAWVLPICQTSSRLHYPGRIKNIEVGRGFSEYPEVADLRW